MNRFLSAGITALYLIVYSAVLANNIFWSVGDQTDVIRAGVAAVLLGIIVSFTYPGDRDGAFFAVTICACINAIAMYYIVRWFTRRRARFESDKS